MAAESVSVTLRERRSDRRSYWFDIVFGRVLPACFFSIFIVDKLLVLADSLNTVRGPHPQATDYLYALNQLLSLGYFTLVVVLYVVRLPKRAGDARPWIIATSLFGSFSVLLASFLPGVPVRQQLQLVSIILVLIGLTYTVWALAYLRRSFSILPEARRLVTGGPYAFSRHPLYLGEGLVAIALNLPTVSWPGATLLALFLVAQYVRIRAEERVLERQFPEYADYRRRVARYLPDPVRLLRMLRAS